MVRRLASVLLRPARIMWRATPAPIRRRLSPSVTRARIALQLGSSLRGRDLPSVRGAHRLVPLAPQSANLPAGKRVKRESAPLVSIVVPVHDDAAFLSTCLRSIQQQGLEGWECLVIDDCSLDSSRSIALELSETDDRFRVVRHDRNLGLAATRNTGLSLARGEYVTFLDADDFLFQDSLADRLAVAEQARTTEVIGSWCDWVAVPEIAGLGFVAPPGEKTGVVDYRSSGGRNQFISTSPLLSTAVVLSLGGFDDTFRTAEDFEFWTRLMRNGFRLVGTGSVGVAYRQKRVSMISADPLGHARNAAAVHDYMSRPLQADAISELASNPLVEPVAGIPAAGALGERLVAFLAYAVLTRDPNQVAGVRAMIHPAECEEIDVDDVIRRALARHALRIGGMSLSDREAVATEVRNVLTEPPIGSTPVAPPAHLGSLATARVALTDCRERRGATAARIRQTRPMPKHKAWDVLLHGSSLAGLRDLLVLGRELTDSGQSVAVLDLNNGGVALRALAHAEGVRVAVQPCGGARLAISTDGVERGIGAPRNLVVSTEPWVGVTPHGLRAENLDLVLVRGDWERDLWTSTNASVQVGGWVSRSSRLESLGRPRDGDLDRGNRESLLVLRAPGDIEGPGRVPIARVLGPDADLVFGPRCSATADELLPLDRVPIVAASVRAVIVIGAGVPVDATISGTPVLAITAEDLITVPGACAVSLDELRSAVDAAEPFAIQSTDEDWLSRQLNTALGLLG